MSEVKDCNVIPICNDLGKVQGVHDECNNECVQNVNGEFDPFEGSCACYEANQELQRICSNKPQKRPDTTGPAVLTIKDVREQYKEKERVAEEERLKQEAQRVGDIVKEQMDTLDTDGLITDINTEPQPDGSIRVKLGHISPYTSDAISNGDNPADVYETINTDAEYFDGIKEQLGLPEGWTIQENSIIDIPMENGKLVGDNESTHEFVISPPRKET
ncbi:hypothetical protein KKA47_07610 [bacterium]|nr:hypothetical protein [bacterium]